MARDRLLRVVKASCYGEHAQLVVDLLRAMMRTYTREESGADPDVNELSWQVFRAVPAARRVRLDGLYPVYATTIKGAPHLCTWSALLAKGSYNHVYSARLTIDGSPVIPAVVRVTAQSDKDLRVYLLENVLHALLHQMPATRELVVPIRYPFKVRQSGFPPYKLGTVMDDPGRGNLGDWIEDHLENDEQMFSVLSQMAHIVQRGQRSVRLMHRDLKADNIMLTTSDADRVTTEDGDEYPTLGMRCLLIDFGMAAFDIDGERVACDCISIHARTEYNPAQDLQNLCCTMLEDYEDVFGRRAPRFLRWLQAVCGPVLARVRELWPDYDRASSASRHRRLSYVVSTEQHPPFAPEQMLAALGKHWGKHKR